MPTWIQKGALWVPAVFLVLVAAAGYYAYREVASSTRDAIRTSLETVLEADAAALQQYFARQRQVGTMIAGDSEIRRISASLEAVYRAASDPASELLAHPDRPVIERQMSEARSILGFAAWGLFSRDGTVLASSDPRRVGLHYPIPPALLATALEGETRVTRPVRSVVFDESGHAPGTQRTAEIRTITPVLDPSGKPTAVLGIAADAAADFAQVLRSGRMGETGETYAFDAEGVLLSGSRFAADLVALGIIAAEEEAILGLEIRDPGGDRTKGFEPTLPERARPLTRMAAAAISEGPGSDIEGYSDYRGVSVVGAWTWLPELELGLATEMDADEAYRGLRRAVRSAALLAAVIGLLILGMAGYALMLRRSQRRFAQASRMGRYQIEEKIGEGGMGKVFLARHALLRRPTALKVLDSEQATDEAVKRFEREVQAVARLTHPNTIAVYDYGRTPDGTFYYAMEYLEGITLARLVESDGAQPEARVKHLLLQMAGSLAEAHTAKLIHRDLKPSNVMICARGGLLDYVKVLDFGLVRGESDDVQLTATRALTGTPQYLSPEGLQSPEAVDARSDIYQLGAIAYVLLTGRPVFQGETLVELLTQHLHATPIPPSEAIGQPVSADLESLVLACLAKDPNDRPADGGALWTALEPCRVDGTWTHLDALLWWEDWSRVHAGSLSEPGSGSSLPSGWEIELGTRSRGA